MDNKKDIIIQVEIASNIYGQIDKLKKELSEINVPTIDMSNIKKIDWSKDLPKGAQTINIRSSLDKGFHLNIKNAKQALNSIRANAIIPIKITPIDPGTMGSISLHDWQKLAPPDEIKDKIKILNSALGSLSNRLTSRKVGGKDGTTKSLAQILAETSTAFDQMAVSAGRAATAVGGVQTRGVASNAAKAGKQGAGAFDITSFNKNIQGIYPTMTSGMNEREIAEANKVIAASERLKIQRRVTDSLARNNESGMQDMGGIKNVFARAFMWGGAASIIYGLAGSIRKAIDVTVDLENEMVQLKKVMDDSTPFDEMKSKMFELASSMGVSITEVTKLAKIWAQQGKNMSETLQLSAVTIDAMNALSIDSAAATDFLTSVTRVWGVELNQLQKTLASVMRVQADYAIESADLASIFTKIGSGVKEAGDSMAFLAGASTALRESTRKTASQIFTSLKTIYAKSFSDEVIKSLADVGVYAKMSADQFRPFSDILGELAGKWSGFSDVQRKSLAITIGQTRYWSDFVALMGNFNIAQNATLSYYRAWDDASKASELQQKSLLNVLKGVSTSLIKIGDTFGTKFFAPLVNSMAEPIKKFADFFATLGGAQSAIVFASTLGLITMSFKSMLGAFPGYEKFLGRIGMAGEIFKQNVTKNAQAIALLGTRIRAVGKDASVYSRAQAIMASSTNLSTKTINSLAVGLTRFNAILVYSAKLLIGFVSTALRFAAWTAAFYLAEKAISSLIGKFEEAKSAAQEFAEKFPADVLEKINSLGSKDKKTGLSLSSFSEIKNALDNLVPLLIKKQKELSTSTEKYVLSWQDVQEIIGRMGTTDSEILKKNYAELTTSVEAQKKFWEDIQTTLAIIQNFTFGDTTKKAQELRESVLGNFLSASGGAEALKKELKNITGLSLNNVDDLYGDEFFNAIAKNIDKIADSPVVKKAILDWDTGFKDQLNTSMYGGLNDGSLLKKAFTGGIMPGTTGDNGISRGIANDLAKVAGFALYSAKDQIIKMSETSPINLYDNLKIGNLDASLVEDPKTLANKQLEGRKYIFDQIKKQYDEITKLGDADALSIANRGKGIEFGKLFIDSPAKASKAFATLSSELEKIRLSYNAGILFPENILNEQQKAYKNYASSIITEYTEANEELDRLAKKRATILSIIQSDPNAATDLKSFDPKKEGIDKFLSNLSELYNATAEGQEDLAAKGNKVLAQNLKEFKATLVALEETKISVGELGSAYENLGPTLLILGKLTRLQEKQAMFDKMAKQDKEFLSKQSVDYLKEELNLQEQISRAFIESEYTRVNASRTGFGELDKIKEKELSLHRAVSKRKTEIDFEEQKQRIINSQPVIPSIIDTGLFGKIYIGEKARAEFQQKLIEEELEKNQENLSIALQRVDLQEDMYSNSQRIIQAYALWNDQLKSVADRSQFIKDTLADSITDFARINETHGLSVLTDTIGKIGRRFQEEQAKIFVNNVINSKVGGFVLPSEEDLKFTERLTATGKTFYESVYGGMHAAVAEMAAVMNLPMVKKPLGDNALLEEESSKLKDLKKAANITAIGNLAATMGLSFLGGNAQNKQQGSQIGSIVGMVLPKLLGANPVVASLVSVASLFAGGALGSLFGGKTDQKQDTMIGQLKLIEQNTARVADLTEKMVNIPGSVFLPPTGGFVIQGGLTINADGIRDPQAVADVVVGRLSQEFGLSSRRSGDRGRF